MRREIEAINSVTFPATVERFIEAQEAGLGRKLSKFGRDLAGVTVDLMNTAYRYGLDGEDNPVTMDDVRRFFDEKGKLDSYQKGAAMWEHICFCCQRAHAAGQGNNSLNGLHNSD